MKVIIIVLTAIALAGCSNPRLYKPGATDADQQRDWAQCDYESEVATAYQSGAAGGVNKAIIKVKCMQAKGYGRAPQ